jgi:hypothetical protein
MADSFKEIPAEPWSLTTKLSVYIPAALAAAMVAFLYLR